MEPFYPSRGTKLFVSWDKFIRFVERYLRLDFLDRLFGLYEKFLIELQSDSQTGTKKRENLTIPRPS